MPPDPSAEPPVVLVVDDEPELAEVFADWLDDDWTVRTATDGEEALERLDDEVSVVLLDRKMPGPSGDEVLEAIDEREHDPRVIMVTAVDPDFDILEMEFDDYLVKPVSKDRLRETVRRVHDRNAYAREIHEFYGLASKRAALITEKASSELEESEEFRELERRIDDLRSTVDERIERLGSHEEFAKAFRDLSADR